MNAHAPHLTLIHCAEPAPVPTSRQPTHRYSLRAWAYGYAIYEDGSLIATFHGPQYDLAAKTMRLLRDEAERPGPEAA